MRTNFSTDLAFAAHTPPETGGMNGGVYWGIFIRGWGV